MFSCTLHLFVNVHPTSNCTFSGVLVKGVLVCLPPTLPAPARLQLWCFIRMSVIKSRREADFQRMGCLSHRFSGAQREKTFMWRITHRFFFFFFNLQIPSPKNVIYLEIGLLYFIGVCIHPYSLPLSLQYPLYIYGTFYLFHPHKQMHTQTSMLTPTHTHTHTYIIPTRVHL